MGLFDDVPAQPFAWPDDKQAAVSLSFDDAWPSQIDRGVGILHRYGIKATFYVVQEFYRQRLEEWRTVACSRHEIGNHTVTHPCSGNHPFARLNALEDYSLERMASELDTANQAVEEDLGVRPTTFAYPCGETYVGRGESVVSYVPLVARRILVGRGFLDESHNMPRYCDLAQVNGCSFDDKSIHEVVSMVDRARSEGGWLILCGHAIGQGGNEVVREGTLDSLCKHLREHADSLLVDTVAAVGSMIQRARQERG